MTESTETVKHHRRSVRLRGYDYAQVGAYFITVCAHHRACLFGAVENGVMTLNATGRIVADEWLRTARIRAGIELDEWVVMPNHFHGILVITDCAGTARRRGTVRRAPTMAEQFGKPVAGSVPTIVRAFKSAVTKRVNELRGIQGAGLWQRNYWEHVVRNEAELDGIRQYIRNNPAEWELDRLYLESSLS